MGGVRLGGIGVIDVISPPFTDYELSDGDTQVWRRSRTNAPGEATAYTDWNDGGTTLTESFNPVLSPDGTMIAYTGRLDSTGLTVLYVCDNQPGSASTLLVDDPDTNINTPMWSPDSSTIIYTRGVPDGNNYGGIIESVPASGGTPTVLLTPASGYRAFRPSYSFDGAFVAFFMQEISGPDDGLWVMEADGSNAGEIATAQYQGNGSQHGWANAELTIAYFDNAGGGSGDAWTIAHDGTGQTQISTGATSGSLISVSKTCWLSDDSAVIVASNQGGGFMSIYALDPAGGGETLLTSNGSSTGAFFRQIFIYRSRLWFIKLTSAANTGTMWSSALDGTDLVEELDVNDGSQIDWFGSGTGFEFQ